MRYNVLKSCAALSCRACVDETTCVAERYLTLRTGCSRGRTPKVVRPQQRKNPLPYSFSQRSHIGNLRQIRKQGKGRSSKRKGNRRCPFLFAPAAGAASPQRRAPHHSAERNFPRFQLTTARKSGIIDTQYRKCDEETSFPSAVLQREDIRCKSLSGAENSHFRAVCN